MKWLFVAAFGLALSVPVHAGDTQDFVFFAEGRPLLVRANVTIDGKPFQQFWETYVDRVMKFLDTDNDGVLSKSEIERRPPVQFITGAQLALPAGKNPGAVNDSFDANKDGKVTRDELAAWLKRNGASPFQFQMNDAGLSPYGVRVVNIGQSEPVQGEALTSAIVTLLDADGDGVLSRQELEAAPAKLRTKDINDDEMITPRELTPPGRGNAMYGFKADVTQAAAIELKSLATTSPDAPVVLTNPSESGAAIARRLLKHYGSKDKQVKKVSANQIGLDRGEFAKLDADRDGLLDSEELSQFVKRVPDIELTVRLGKHPDDQPAIGVTSRVANVKLDKIEGGAMRLTLGVTRVELRAGEPNDNGKINFNFRLKDQYVNQFKMADADNNNYLDEKEAARNPTFAGIFKALDTDGDGMLYEKEMVAYLDRLEELQKAIRDGCVTLTLADKGSGLFDQLDTNHDGRLSVRELRNAPALLGKLDTDNDGKLARTEVPRNFEMRTRRGPASGGDFGSVVVVARATFLETSPTPEAGPGPKWFRRMDSNKDGDLSRREFLGTDDHFKFADADGDGLISAAEAEAADKKWTANRK